MPDVPFLDLKAQIQPIRDEIWRELELVVDRTAFASGPAAAAFEEDFAAYSGVRECVALNSGTSALHVAMRCLDIGPGDEVITVSMSFVATAWPILYLGARPVFVDIDPERFTLDPSRLEAALTPRTRAIVPVHLYGQCADMDPILELAKERGIPVIEDAAQAAGAKYKGRRAGSMGTIGCFSFYPGKNLGAWGEGGAITTDSLEIAERARRLRDHGQSQKHLHDEVGYNYRMDGLQGAVLRVKLRYLDEWNDRRRQVARLYDSILQTAPIRTPKACPDGEHIYHLYVIRSREREALREGLQERGIQTGLHYPKPIHTQEPFVALACRPGDLPVSEALGRQCLSLPIFPELSEVQIRRVAEALGATT